MALIKYYIKFGYWYEDFSFFIISFIFIFISDLQNLEIHSIIDSGLQIIFIIITNNLADDESEVPRGVLV